MSFIFSQTSDSPLKETAGNPTRILRSNQLPRNTNMINPQEEGTVNAFGGTAGSIKVPLNQKGDSPIEWKGVPTLPTTPYLKDRNQPGIGTQIPQGNPFVNSNDSSLNGPKPSQELIREKTSVLNKDTTFGYTDFNTLLLSEGQNRLKHLENQANRYLLQKADSQRFYNLSLSQIVDHTILTIIAVFADLLAMMKPDEVEKRKYMSYSEIARKYANIFIRKDRMIYVGVFLIFLSLLFMVIFLSS